MHAGVEPQRRRSVWLTTPGYDDSQRKVLGTDQQAGPLHRGLAPVEAAVHRWELAWLIRRGARPSEALEPSSTSRRGSMSRCVSGRVPADSNWQGAAAGGRG